MFDFLKKKGDAENPELGADATPSPSGSPASSLAAASAERALQLSALSPRKKQRRTAGTGGDDQRALQDKVDAEIRAQLDQVHDPKAWGALLASPGDVMLAITGRKHWEISRDERDTLGACGSAAARTMMIHNPKTLAFFMVGAALFSVFVPRMVKEMEHHREQKAKAAKEAPKP